MSPLSIRYQETMASLRQLLADHPASAMQPFVPAPVASLASLALRCADTLLTASTLQQPHPVLPLLLELSCALHLGLRHLAAAEADTQRKGRIQGHAHCWQRLRVALVAAPQWTAWGLARIDVAPMTDPPKNGLPANPFEAYIHQEPPAVLQSDDAQKALRTLLYSDLALRPLPAVAVGDLARTLVAGTQLMKGVA